MLYPSAKAIAFNPSHPCDFLMLRRNDYYEPAGGKVRVSFAQKQAESFEQCAIRECKEELGATIEISHYLGSYYFFWTRFPECMSVCALYAASITSVDATQPIEEDFGGFPMEPVWVNAYDILNGNVPISPSFVGLEDLIKKFAQYQLSVRPSGGGIGPTT